MSTSASVNLHQSVFLCIELYYMHKGRWNHCRQRYTGTNVQILKYLFHSGNHNYGNYTYTYRSLWYLIVMHEDCFFKLLYTLVMFCLSKFYFQRATVYSVSFPVHFTPILSARHLQFSQVNNRLVYTWALSMSKQYVSYSS